jgi:hypothetical protein
MPGSSDGAGRAGTGHGRVLRQVCSHCVYVYVCARVCAECVCRVCCARFESFCILSLYACAGVFECQGLCVCGEGVCMPLAQVMLDAYARELSVRVCVCVECACVRVCVS